MVALGFSELLLMLALVGLDNGRNDIVSLIPAKEYFKARDIEPTIDKLLALAAESPTSGKKQIAQLLALRQLAADAASAKKSPKADQIRDLLRQIADGKKANDATGFAAEYAKRALTALDGGKNESPAIAGWKEGAAWIPDNVTFFAAVDSRGAPTGRKAPDLAPLFGMIPREAKDKMFDMIDKLGNIRIDRLVFGFRELPKQEFEYFVRATGKLNPKWLAEVVRAAQVKIEERTPKAGPTIRVMRPLQPDGKGPAMALVGDSEFLMAGAGFAGPRQGGAPVMAEADTVALDKMLALAAKPGQDATQGDLKADLAKVPAAAAGLVVGKIPAWLGAGAPFPLPKSIRGHIRRDAGRIDVQVRATMSDADAATKLVETIQQAVKSGVEALGKFKGQPIPGINLKALIEMLENIEPRVDGNAVQLRLRASPEAIMSLPAYLFY